LGKTLNGFAYDGAIDLIVYCHVVSYDYEYD
jgi:hypothetical protein